MTADFSFEKIIILAIFLLPGYVFLLTVSRHCFPGGRLFAGKTIQFFAAVILSAFVFLTFDQNMIRTNIADVLSSQDSLNTTFSNIVEQLKNKPLLQSTLEYLLAPEAKNFDFSKNKVLSPHKILAQKENEINLISYLIKVIVLFVAPFSWLFATFVTAFFAVGNFLMKTQWSKLFFWTYYLITWIGDKIFVQRWLINPLLWGRRKLVEHIISLLVRCPRNVVIYLIRPFFKIKQMCDLFILLVLLVAFISLTMFFVLSLLPVEIIFYIYYRLMRLFSPASSDILTTFNKRYSIPILEILNDKGFVLKGRYEGMLPDEKGQIMSLTLSNVIQYAPKDPLKPLSSNDRNVYIFPHFDSKLTVLSSAMRDFNIWYLPQDIFQAFFMVKTLDDLERLSWYLTLFLRSHKVTFDFPKEWSFTVSADLAPKFCLRILEILRENYSPKKSSLKPFILRRKLQSLLRKFRPVFFKYLKEYKNSDKNNETKNESVETLNEAIKMFREMNHICR